MRDCITRKKMTKSRLSLSLGLLAFESNSNSAHLISLEYIWALITITDLFNYTGGWHDDDGWMM